MATCTAAPQACTRERGSAGTPREQGLQWLREEATLAGSCGSLQERDVNGEVCKHDEHEFVQDLVVWLASDLVPIGHARISNSGGPCRQQQQPDGHASAWTERSSDTVHGKVGAKS